MTTNDSSAVSADTLQKHCIHMEQTVWDQATQTARSLGLSTSQFISRLVDETSGQIGRGGLLGSPAQSQGQNELS